MNDTEVFVTFADLIIGDVIRGARLCNGKEVRWSAPHTVLGIKDNCAKLTEDCCVLTSDATHFLVVRSVRRADFPHHCTRCGRPAYVGLNETDHADESSASTCPAPRGRMSRAS